MLAALMALALPTPPLSSTGTSEAGVASFAASNLTDPWTDAHVVSCPR